MAAPTATAAGEIPFINLAAATANWRELCDKVREACETHGCFCLKTDEIPGELRDRMVAALSQLFDLPEDTKKRHVHPKPYRSYLGKNDVVPYLESFGIDHSPQLDEARAFSDLMWPHGNPAFSEAVNEMSTKMLELNLLLMKMIFTSFGLDSQLYESYVADSASNLRLMKYKVPPTISLNEESGCESSGIGLLAHTDKNGLTILGQNDVQGLEIQTKDDGEWVQVVIPDGGFIAVVGDTLKAWSNGRLHAVRHRVVIRGEKERYSWGMFLMPKEVATIEVPKEFVDKEHSLLYPPFNYAEYLSYFVNKLGDDALEIYAGVSPIGIA
ncbi:Probable 2-oxoglutarate-dependent dioxygenase AOP1 [Linum perenne]